MLTTTRELGFLKSRLSREDFIDYCDLCASIGERQAAAKDDGNVMPGEATGPGPVRIKNVAERIAHDTAARARRDAAADFAARFPNASPLRVM